MSTDFLFAQPGYGSGAARVLDLFGLFDEYNDSLTPREADARAIFSDWWMVAQDFQGTTVRLLDEELRNPDHMYQLSLL